MGQGFQDAQALALLPTEKTVSGQNGNARKTSTEK